MIRWLEKHIWNRTSGQILLLALLLLAAWWTDGIPGRPVAPGSPEAAVILPEPAITQGGNQFTWTLTFRARNRIDVPYDQALQSLLSYTSSYDMRDLSIEANDRAGLETILERLKALDQPVRGERLIHGQLTGERGQPVVGAQVDLLGNYSSINACRTRPDGTFSLVLYDPVPPSRVSGRLRFRLPSRGGNCYSHRITLTDEQPVLCMTFSRSWFVRLRGNYWPAGLLVIIFAAHDARRVRAYLRCRRRLPGTCPTCGYDLKGTPGENCSECGNPIPDVVLIELGREPNAANPHIS